MDKYILLPVNTPTFVCLFLNEDKIDLFFYLIQRNKVFFPILEKNTFLKFNGHSLIMIYFLTTRLLN